MGCDYCERPVGASHAVTCPLKGYVTERTAPPLATPQGRMVLVTGQQACWEKAVGVVHDGGSLGREIGLGDVGAGICWADAEIRKLTAERDAAIRERDAANEECGRLRAKIVVMEGSAQRDMEAEIAVEEAWERCEIAPHWPSDETGSSHRYAASMEGEIVRLRARVAELENAAKLAPAANAGGEKQEPVAWGVLIDSGRGLYGHYDFESEARGVCDAVNADEGWSMTVVPLYAAPVAESATTPQPPRGWLTEGERRLIERLKESSEAFPPSMKYIDDVTVRGALAIFDALLARSTPPRVVLPPDGFGVYEGETPIDARDRQWLAALAAAGVEVKEVGR